MRGKENIYSTLNNKHFLIKNKIKAADHEIGGRGSEHKEHPWLSGHVHFSLPSPHGSSPATPCTHPLFLSLNKHHAFFPTLPHTFLILPSSPLPPH